LWLHEIKHDGFRIIARKNGAQVRLYSRPGNDLTRRFPLIVETLARLRSRSCIIEKYLYVWGRMTYVDGFKRPRYLNFCHRYPWDKRETPSGGGFLISEEHGRYHEHGGNDAD